MAYASRLGSYRSADVEDSLHVIEQSPNISIRHLGHHQHISQQSVLRMCHDQLRLFHVQFI
jgi:hypothetical protein